MTDNVANNVKKWISSLLFSDADSVGLEMTDLSQLLKDGTILCQVVTKLKPGNSQSKPLYSQPGVLSQEDWIASPQGTGDYIFNIGGFL
jgi:hypothetical protein